MSSLFHKKEKKVEEQPKGDLTKLDDREATFRNQRWPSSLPASDLMADAGFYFTPTDKNADCCTCYQCGVKMFNWLPDDTPKYEHKKFSPTCREVKSWTDVLVDESDRANLNRAEQTESHGKLRAKLADKAKRLAGGFHRKEDAPNPNGPLPSLSKEPSNKVLTSASSTAADGRELTEEEQLADVQRRREVAERSLEGLEKLASFYHQGSTEQKRAEESISAQRSDLEKLRSEEDSLSANMSNLTFGRTWNTNTTSVPEPLSPVMDSAESPQSGRAHRRVAPMLPSQMKKDAVPRMPAHLERANPAPIAKVPSYEAPSYEAFTKSKEVFAVEEPAAEEWITYHTDAGVPYYYSTLTKTTVWTIPSSSESLTPITSN